MRLLIVTAAVAAFSFPAFAQQGRPQQPPPQQQRPAQPQPQQQPPQQTQAPAPGMFACRTEAEICYIAIVTGPNQVSVLYTNDPKADGIEGQPIQVQGGDLGQHNGKVVMLTGEYGQNAISKAEVVDVASPLLSFAIKSMLSAEEEPEPEPAPPARPQPRQQPQQRR
jgi:hypothetical protein